MTLDEYRNEARRQFGALTAYRLGYVIGRAGDYKPNPYEVNGTERTARWFAQGVESGREQLKRQGKPL